MGESLVISFYIYDGEKMLDMVNGEQTMVCKYNPDYDDGKLGFIVEGIQFESNEKADVQLNDTQYYAYTTVMGGQLMTVYITIDISEHTNNETLNVSIYQYDGEEMYDIGERYQMPITITTSGSLMRYTTYSEGENQEIESDIEIFTIDRVESTLTSITIPDSVTSIGSYAFSSCSALTSITIPDSVTSVGYDAFKDRSGLTSITIPDSVTSIGEQVFYNCSGLTSVTIGNGVTSIGNWAFYNCRSLTSVTIGNCVTSISTGFNGCRSLTSITFKGTTSQWNAITKDSGWKLGVPTTCQVVCTDGTISI